MDINKDGLTEEVEALQSIFMDELELTRDQRKRLRELSITLHPATAQNEAEQYVCATLHIQLSSNYPATSPRVSIKNPRGLSDETLERLHNACLDKAEEYEGMPVLYELIQLVRDGLTSCNIPSGECCICLLGFTEKDVFTRTLCYHHFHSRCLGEYVASTLQQFEEEDNRDKIERPNCLDRPKRQVVCPVCREMISYDVDKLMNAPSPLHGQELASFNPTSEIRALQAKMAILFEKQQKMGGHIDPEAAKKSQYLVITQQSPPTDNSDPENVMENSEVHIIQDEVTSPDEPTPVEAADCDHNRYKGRSRGRYRGWHRRYYEDGAQRGRSRTKREGASRKICDSDSTIPVDGVSKDNGEGHDTHGREKDTHGRRRPRQNRYTGDRYDHQRRGPRARGLPKQEEEWAHGTADGESSARERRQEEDESSRDDDPSKNRGNRRYGEQIQSSQRAEENGHARWEEEERRWKGDNKRYGGYRQRDRRGRSYRGMHRRRIEDSQKSWEEGERYGEEGGCHAADGKWDDTERQQGPYERERGNSFTERRQRRNDKAKHYHRGGARRTRREERWNEEDYSQKEGLHSDQEKKAYPKKNEQSDQERRHGKEETRGRGKDAQANHERRLGRYAQSDRERRPRRGKDGQSNQERRYGRGESMQSNLERREESRYGRQSNQERRHGKGEDQERKYGKRDDAESNQERGFSRRENADSNELGRRGNLEEKDEQRKLLWHEVPSSENLRWDEEDVEDRDSKGWDEEEGRGSRRQSGRGKRGGFGTRYYRRRWSKELPSTGEPSSQKSAPQSLPPKSVSHSEQAPRQEPRAPMIPPPGFQFVAPPPGFAVRPRFPMPFSSS